MVATTLKPLPIEASRIRLEIRSLQAQLVEWRRGLHQKPELGFKEKLTSAFISQKLQEWGIPHQTGVAETGIVALIEGSQSGPVLGIRADMDALPIHEANEVPYRSQHEGRMHACGHDGHVAIALGTAYYLMQHREQLAGTVKFIFQPAEEGPGGAKPMIDAGALENPSLDAIIGLHLWNNLPLGTVGVRAGALMAAVEQFDLVVQGRGGHGAMPHQTVDAIVVASQIVNALQTVVARNLDPIQSGVVTVGKFNAGSARNVIADSASLNGTVRYFDPKLSTFFETRIRELIGGICQGFGATYSLDYQRLYPPVMNDRAIADLVRSVAESVVETPVGVVPECQTMGGEDMSYFLQEVPGCYFFLGSANVDKGLAYPHHHPRFDFDETALGLGVEMFIRCVEAFNHCTF
ncbi:MULTISPECIES: M20 family metallopeptidase [unclassified Leptolyngbya]|uniref:M20 metallopeptidase family protein n=1 Tax=unclassified Leptolyngbya TaxID=2650499 RepID=UPI001685EEBD|nr:MULTISPECIES: M20 family metallopeptidase [unclassified Leptolyngbya]MBD1913668.1 amidohydrolase [Leptolyngbya sp. FACHB-8]MBD2157048.1 amidohydrolase [Leptolyngbya sp. FACHB-16]